MWGKRRNQASEEDQQSDESKDELVLQGQAEARRLKTEVISKLDKKLKPLAKHILKIGLQVKDATVAVRSLRSQYWSDFNQQRMKASSRLSQAMKRLKADLQDSRPYQPGTIQAAFEEYQFVAQQHKNIEAKVAASEESEELEKLLEKEYAASVFVLDDKAKQLKVSRAPWELRYFGTSEFDKATGKMTVGVSIHHPTSSLDDKCLLCHRVIPSKARRIRCFECSHHNAMCSECFDAAVKVDSILNAQETMHDSDGWQTARQEVLQFAPHLDHFAVHEYDSICGLRNQVRNRPNKNSNQAPVLTTRKLLPRFLNGVYANRPFFGVPNEDGCQEVNHDDSFCHEIIPYRWFTYKAVWQVVSLITKELVRTLPPILEQEKIRGPEIALFSSASPIFFAMQMACVALGRISVGMDTSWEINDVQAALLQSQVTTLLMDPDGFRMLLRSNPSTPSLPPNIKKVVVVATDPFRLDRDPE
jgi:hypothetical protein